jgi:hypothetical protein
VCHWLRQCCLDGGVQPRLDRLSDEAEGRNFLNGICGTENEGRRPKAVVSLIGSLHSVKSEMGKTGGAARWPAPPWSSRSPPGLLVRASSSLPSVKHSEPVLLIGSDGDFQKIEYLLLGCCECGGKNNRVIARSDFVSLDVAKQPYNVKDGGCLARPALRIDR